MVANLFDAPGAGQETEIFAFASDVDADQRIEIGRMESMLERALTLETPPMQTWLFVASLRPRVDDGPGGRGRRLHAQSRENPAPGDPRVGLKPGFRDAGQAVLNIELVVDAAEARRLLRSRRGRPACPRPIAPTTSREPTRPRRLEPRTPRHAGRRPEPACPSPTRISRFSGDRMFVGNFHGFNTYVIENARQAAARCRRWSAPAARATCPVHGNLLFMSVEQTRGRVDCGTGGVEPSRSARSGSAACASSTSATSASRGRSRRCRRAAARTRTR